MNLTASTYLTAHKDQVFARLNAPENFAELNDSIDVVSLGGCEWVLKAVMNGAEVEADLLRTECEAPSRVAYQAKAQGLLITVGFDLAEAKAGTDLAVTLAFAGESMKGKMLMQGLKLMGPKMQSGLEKMVQKLAQAA